MSERRSFQKLNSENYEIQRLQERVEDVFNAVNASPLPAGRLLADLSVGITTQEFNHGLGRSPLGYFIVRSNNGESVFDDQENNTKPTRTLRLTATAATTVSLWVF